ncbi:MAG TPA: F0F1 ATP synthase subunit A [Pseudonocardiaceae bacterium]|jgi:F-type H+-transporting ATPase subunit a|nr:F0F1 ATP synthase subunit A [Pseudonocardiaceae bacterium]
MTELVLTAEGGVQVGVHPEVSFFGLAFNVDTVISTLISAAIVAGFAFYLKAKSTSGVPSGIQLAWETVVDWIEGQVEQNMGVRTAPFVVPLAIALFVFILISNWLAILPHSFEEYVRPPTADVNLTFALAFFVIILVHITGFRKKGVGYLKHFVHPTPLLLPINIIEELVKPFTLALRLFGNIFAGTVMVSILALLPAYVMWFPTSAWKLFDLAIGLIQAIIFSVLTIVYFGFAAAQDEEGAH